MENTGNITLTNLTVDDGMADCSLSREADITGDGDDDFEIGEEWAYTCSITAQVGIHENTATADSDETDPAEEDTAEYRSLPDISLSKVVSDASPEVGDTITFTIKVANKGDADATTIEVTDVVPDGFTYVPNSITGGDSRDDSDPAGGGLTWTINNLNRNVTATLTFQAKVLDVSDPGAYQNMAQVTACDQEDPDSEPGNYGDDDVIEG